MSGLKVHVGKASLVGHIERYAQKFDFVEVRAEPSLVAKRLRRLREGAPEHFAFSVVAPRELCLLERSIPDRALVDSARSVSEALSARFVLLRTPATVAPSQRTKARLAALVDALRGAAKDVAWEPRGIWTEDESEAFADELGVALVRDLAEQDPPASEVVYTRLLALGRNQRIGSGALERLAERIAAASEAFVIVEGDGAVGVARRLRELREELDDDEQDSSAVRLVRNAAFLGGAGAIGGELTGSEDETDDEAASDEDAASAEDDDSGEGDEEFEDEDDDLDEDEDDEDDEDE
jgi:uncharacterized protein YecE (DUF72 family)